MNTRLKLDRFFFLQNHSRFPLPRHLLAPLQVSSTPHVDQTEKEDAYKDGDLNESEQPVARVEPFLIDGGARENESHFDIKNEEGKGNRIESEIEENPGRTDRAFAAFVGGELVGDILNSRSEYPGDRNDHKGHHETQDDEDEDVGKIKQQRCPPLPLEW